jgi:hypothetical protein
VSGCGKLIAEFAAVRCAKSPQMYETTACQITVTPAKSGGPEQLPEPRGYWMPAFAGLTNRVEFTQAES